jgi:hypothetical protein
MHELNAAHEWEKAFNARPLGNVSSIAPGNDPPDIECLVDGRRCSVELTRLVDAESFKRRKSAYKSGRLIHDQTLWSASSLIEELSSLIRKKSERYRRTLLGRANFDFLVIYTDEHWIEYEHASRWLSDFRPPEEIFFNRIHLMLSYHPEFQHHPIIELI